MKQIIWTKSAPKAIGVYSQAVKAGNTVYISGQIPLQAETMELISSDFLEQARQTFENLRHITQAAGGDLNNIVRLTVYLTDLSNFSATNDVMSSFFHEPYPARVSIGVASLPKQAQIEVDAIMVLSD